MEDSEGFQWRSKRTASSGLLAFGCLIGVTGIVIDSWKGPSWILLSLGIVSVLGGAFHKLASSRAADHDRQDSLLRAGSRGIRDTAELPRVNELNLTDFRVQKASIQISYQSRECEAALRNALIEGAPALILGHSMAGKSHMAAHIVRDLYGSWPIWIPERPNGLRQLMPEGCPRDTVVWLDDIEGYLTSDEPFRAEWLDLMRHRNCRVVATIRTSAYESFQPSGEARLPEWEALERFERIWMLDSEVERERIAAQVPIELRSGVRQYGLAEYVGGGYLATDRFNSGISQHPLAVAMLRAAADWRRVGLERITRSRLIELADTYKAVPTRVGGDESVDVALEWASTPIVGNIRLLEPSGDEWRVFDYLLDYLATEDREIPDSTWMAATADASISQCFRLGMRAYRSGNKHIAKLAWMRGALASPSASNLRRLLLGDATSPAHLQADTSVTSQTADHTSGSPYAADLLGDLLKDEGNIEAAKAAYQLAIDSGNTFAGAYAANDLGKLLAEEGDSVGAKAAYQLAIDSGESNPAAYAEASLGDLLAEEGDTTGAKAAYQRAINSEAASGAKAYAANDLGQLLVREGDTTGAKAAYQLAIDSGESNPAAYAANSLGNLLAKEGDTTGAKAAYQLAIDSGESHPAAYTANSLGNLLAREGDTTGAKAAYQLAIDSGESNQAAYAANSLGNLLAKEGDTTGAKAAYQQAIDSGMPDPAAVAAIGLGDLLAKEGDTTAAKAAYQQAIDLEVPPAVRLASDRLETLLAIERDT